MSTEYLKRMLDTFSKSESHRTVAETRYWCVQYKLLAQQAVEALAQPEQKPMGWITYESAHRLLQGGNIRGAVPIHAKKSATAKIPVYITPPQQERNFCPRCGKRLGKNDWDMHTCTPPRGRE